MYSRLSLHQQTFLDEWTGMAGGGGALGFGALWLHPEAWRMVLMVYMGILGLSPHSLHPELWRWLWCSCTSTGLAPCGK